MSPEEREQAIAEEQRRARQLRMIVDLTCLLLMQGGVSRSEADALVAATRRQALALFPGKEDTYELILAPRFARLIREFVPPDPGARVLPFDRPPRG